jgi:serine/threonine protein kinase
MALSLNDFGKAVVAAELVSADELKALFASSAAGPQSKDPIAFAKLLVERGAVTGYQAAELLAGRGHRLMLDDYIVQDKIGAGGMGQVLKAVHRKMGRTVALKLMSTAAMKDEAAIKRFHREVKAAARLEHPNIVTAHSAGEARGMHYLVMQYVEGHDLSSRVKKDGPLSIDLALDCVCQAARGLAYAHGEGIIHRDIKPANLLLDKKGNVKILDMGLARIDGGDANDGLTGTEQVLGTVDYMSPEQAISTRDCDARADIYSLGCTLWFLITGTKMYAGNSPIQRIMQHREAPLPSLLAARDDIPWALEKLFHRMVAKRPEDRCQTMDEIVQEIEQIRGVSDSGGGRGVEDDTNLGQFFKTLGGKESTRLSTHLKAVREPSSAADEPTLGHSDSLEMPDSVDLSKPSWKNPLVLSGAGAAAVLLLLLIVWIITRDKDNTEIVRAESPPSSASETKSKAGKDETKKGTKAASSSKVGTGTPSAEPSKSKSPFVVGGAHLPGIPSEAFTFRGHRYQFIAGDMSWNDAKARAEELGGHLVSLTSLEEDNWLRSNLLKEMKSERLVWIGGEKQDKSAPWRWVTGEPFTYTNWVTGEGTDASASGIGYVNYAIKGIGWGDWVRERLPIAQSGSLQGTSRAAGFIVEWDDASGPTTP